ncbi:hypothetical protein [Streptomyces triculaminicus]|uniref:hypothetical protein n=1 Tax=Streptomyces triculaminicus TaxID=2816232 RepID=UPI0037CF2A28
MEEKPESGEQPPEREHADSGWVLRPDVPSGTSFELASLTKAEHLTPDTLELLHQLMVKVQEPEGAGLVAETCGSLTGCAAYSATSCSQLETCSTFTRPSK